MSAQPRLTLISRSYCHLCDDMKVALLAMRDLPAFDLIIRDVDEDTDLLNRFDELVPVLIGADSTVLCHYHLDTAKVREYPGGFE